MIRRPPRSTRTDTLFPYTTLFRSNQILQSQSCQLLGQDEVQKLLDTLQAAAPQLVGNITKALSLQTITQVLQTLLDESVPVRDFRRIVEALAGVAHRTQDPAELTELIRPRSAERRVGKEGVSRFRLRW